MAEYRWCRERGSWRNDSLFNHDDAADWYLRELVLLPDCVLLPHRVTPQWYALYMAATEERAAEIVDNWRKERGE